MKKPTRTAKKLVTSFRVDFPEYSEKSKMNLYELLRREEKVLEQYQEAIVEARRIRNKIQGARKRLQRKLEILNFLTYAECKY
jgi:hypothetical protein